jgi:ribonuclease VapC
VIIDTSAIMAILQEEVEAPQLLRAIEDTTVCRMSAGSLVELFVVTERQKDPDARRILDAFLQELDADVVPVTEAHARIARDAYNAYGKGRGVRAQLNSGDCFAYALARERDEPLLFVGNDFIHTDITPALEPSGAD